MKVFRELFQGMSNSEYAMAGAIIIAFVMIMAGAGSSPTFRGDFEDYHGPRA